MTVTIKQKINVKVELKEIKEALLYRSECATCHSDPKVIYLAYKPGVSKEWFHLYKKGDDFFGLCFDHTVASALFALDRLKLKIEGKK